MFSFEIENNLNIRMALLVASAPSPAKSLTILEHLPKTHLPSSNPPGGRFPSEMIHQ